MSEAEGATTGKEPRDGKRMLAIGTLIVIAAIFSFLNADERIAVNLGFTTLYRLSLVGVVFSVFVLGMLTMFLFGLRHDRAVRNALRNQTYRQPLPIRPLSPLPVSLASAQETSDPLQPLAEEDALTNRDEETYPMRDSSGSVDPSLISRSEPASAAGDWPLRTSRTAAEPLPPPPPPRSAPNPEPEPPA